MALTAADINGFVAKSFPASGSECVDVGDGFAVARRVITPELIRPGGFVSGPTQFGLADGVLWYALFGAVGIEPMAMTSELSMRFLRPASGEVLFARAELHQAGRRNVVGTVTLWMDDRTEKTVSVAQGTYVRPSAERA